jgi:hypothetical protein
MALQRLRNDPEAGWELRKRTPLWSPDFLMVSPDCKKCKKAWLSPGTTLATSHACELELSEKY